MRDEVLKLRKAISVLLTKMRTNVHSSDVSLRTYEGTAPSWCPRDLACIHRGKGLNHSLSESWQKNM